MTQAFLDLTGLTRYHSNLKAVVVGSLSVSGTTITYKDLSGTSLGTITTQDTTYSDATTSTHGLMSTTDKSKLDGISSQANKVAASTSNGYILIDGTSTKVYGHPTATAQSSGLYKITVDGYGHVTAVTAVVKSDITDLGIPGQDTTYSNATTSAAGLMSSTDKTKLDGVATGAQVNVIETINVTTDSGTSALTPSSKAVTIDLSPYALKSAVSSAISYKGQVTAYSDLPASPSTGDMYNVTTADSTHGLLAGDNVIWDGTDWDVLTGTIVFDTITNTQIDNLFS